MNILNVAKTVGTVAGKGALELMKIGAWGAMNQYTHNQFKKSNQHFIGEATRGAEYAGRKLKLIKND